MVSCSVVRPGSARPYGRTSPRHSNTPRGPRVGRYAEVRGSRMGSRYLRARARRPVRHRASDRPLRLVWRYFRAHKAYTVRESKSSYVFLILRRMIYRFISRYHANRIRFDPVVSAGRRVGIRGARAAAVRTEGVTLSVSRGAAADRRDRTADRTADRTGRGAVGPCCRVPDAAVSAVASFGRTPSIRAPRELHKALLSGAPQTHRGTPNKQLPVALPKARCHVL